MYVLWVNPRLELHEFGFTGTSVLKGNLNIRLSISAKDLFYVG